MSITTEKIQASVIELQERLQQNMNRGRTDKQGSLFGTSKIVGYVCAIHGEDDPDETLQGTVDVQEFAYDHADYNGSAVGFHEGVRISANLCNKGYKIVPCLYSEVVIQQDPHSLVEYVTLFSHATIIDLKSHDEVNIGVTEYKPFVETDNGLDKDYDELEETGNKTSTNYTATSITDQIVSPKDEEGFKQEKTVEHKVITVGKTKVLIDGSNVTIETDGKVEFKVGGSTITEQDGKINVKTDNATIEGKNTTIKADNAKVEAKDVKVDGKTVTVTGGTLKVKGQSSTDGQGPFNPIKVCPYSGVPHCGSTVSGT